jgi:hypothetical protein
MKAAELIARCFAARTAAHIAHLQTTSYAQHVALDEFYNAIVGLANMVDEILAQLDKTLYKLKTLR